jgi:hypothetical protein
MMVVYHDSMNIDGTSTLRSWDHSILILYIFIFSPFFMISKHLFSVLYYSLIISLHIYICVCVCGGGILSQFTHIKLDFYILNKTCKTRLTLCGPCPSILKSKESQIRNHTESLNLHPLYHLRTSIMSHDCVFNIRFFRLSLLFSFICVCVCVYIYMIF